MRDSNSRKVTHSMIEVDGKFFARGGRRFAVRGVTYGTFAPRQRDGERFPPRSQMKADFAAMREAGFNTVRTYTAPPSDLLGQAAASGLAVLAGVHWNDWRYLIGSSGRQRREVARTAVRTVRDEARRLAGNPDVLGLCIGNEIPADVVRWVGSERVSDLIEELAWTIHSEDPDRLVTYANYPSTEYLSLRGLDFSTFNVFLERAADLRKYLTRLHNLIGDQPLVIGELGRHVETGDDGESRQAGSLDEQLSTVLERGAAGACVFSWTDDWHVGDARVEGWRFGLTRSDRSPRPALSVAAHWNRRTVADLLPRDEWPSVAVVICAYNAGVTLDECLRHTCALDYEPLEIIVVDDGSTDDTASIAASHPRAGLLQIDHAGLGAARNAGFRAASSEIVAYLDADAYPSPEWPYYLALAFDSRLVGGAGGPNVSPPTDTIGSQRVAHAPGGPAHVLLSDDRAEHVPGCNMAFWRVLLVEAAGFDPVYSAAGDDVDLCWRIIDRGWQLAFHPAALVWHHRRSNTRAYLRQQRGYGRAEALVAARHPDRFTGVGSARWGGTIYGPRLALKSRTRIYRGAYGGAAFQSIYGAGGAGLDLLHQLGVPAAFVILLGCWLCFLVPWFVIPTACALVFLAVLVLVDARSLVLASPRLGRRFGFRLSVALLSVAQPLARAWGRVTHTPAATRSRPPAEAVAGPLLRTGNVLVAPEQRSRVETMALIVASLRRAGLVVLPSAGWEEPDATVVGSSLVAADILSVGQPAGVIQIRSRRRIRALAWLAPFLVTAAALLNVTVGLLLGALALVEVARGWWRTGWRLRRAIDGATGDTTDREVEQPPVEADPGREPEVVYSTAAER
jgi:cellulose synthase/poly-beta-1,6-N-acetylglucosamine synthase-like glycosyltransferase